jgi:hypothetical protein
MGTKVFSGPLAAGRLPHNGIVLSMRVAAPPAMFACGMPLTDGAEMQRFRLVYLVMRDDFSV